MSVFVLLCFSTNKLSPSFSSSLVIFSSLYFPPDIFLVTYFENKHLYRNLVFQKVQRSHSSSIQFVRKQPFQGRNHRRVVPRRVLPCRVVSCRVVSCRTEVLAASRGGASDGSLGARAGRSAPPPASTADTCCRPGTAQRRWSGPRGVPRTCVPLCMEIAAGAPGQQSPWSV